jgi:hypothetical protein
LKTRIRPGHVASIVDVSAGGALIETARRLLPGSTIELQLDREHDHVAVRGTIARCAVSRLHPAIVWYRGAIVFDSVLPGFPSASSDGYCVLPHVRRSGASFRAPTTPDVL